MTRQLLGTFTMLAICMLVFSHLLEIGSIEQTTFRGLTDLAHAAQSGPSHSIHGR